MKINFENLNWESLLIAVKDPIGLIGPSLELQAFTDAFSNIYSAIANKSPRVNDPVLSLFSNEKRPEVMALLSEAGQDHFSLTDTLEIKNKRIETHFMFFPFSQHDQKRAGYLLLVQTKQPYDHFNQTKLMFTGEHGTAASSVRQEIAQELHDNVNQLLSAAQVSIDVVRTDLQKNEELLNRSLYLLGSAVQEIRILSGELVKDAAGISDLQRAIEQLVEDISLGSSINIQVEYAGFSETSCSLEFKTNVFRIIQEQLNNILKHSGASNVLLSLSQQERKVHLIVSDNGKGFDPKVERTGIGLYSISQRVSACNATMKLLTNPGEGCTLDIYFNI